MGGIVGACLYGQSNAHTDTQFHSWNVGVNSANTKLRTSIIHLWFLSWDVQSVSIGAPKIKTSGPSILLSLSFPLEGNVIKRARSQICVCGTKRKVSVCLHVNVCLCTHECISVREVKVILDFKFISSAVLWCPTLSTSFSATKLMPRSSYPITHD